MMQFLLVVAGEVVDSADSPAKLDFSKTFGYTHYEIMIGFDDSIFPGVTVDLTGHEDQADWVAQEVCREIEFRRAFPGFEDELKVIDGPFLAFGEV